MYRWWARGGNGERSKDGRCLRARQPSQPQAQKPQDYIHTRTQVFSPEQQSACSPRLFLTTSCAGGGRGGMPSPPRE